eukprot:CAMPEP_0201113092 /NCGR_PEP_ID=MMETSP0812-20130820/77637_1 /ASSEMBLY_ACC=CAM_ASM_000668 /TAXON_ID=98059 /ORGANISM="Dinobryon sp., Strain UTEXLB2267" /LENGTH=704 /DNA_ID=CAMNT_0047376563 /DNA_START=958 /DNA_END=3073 /DNA_ORIENTATION=+
MDANETKLFMRYISHEIRTPLNTAVMGLRLLNDELQSAGSIECLQMVKDTQESCQVAIGILSEMLMFDKVESGLLVLEKEIISPVQFIRSVLSPFTVQAREAGVNFIFNQSLHPDHTHIALNALLYCVHIWRLVYIFFPSRADFLVEFRRELLDALHVFDGRMYSNDYRHNEQIDKNGCKRNEAFHAIYLDEIRTPLNTVFLGLRLLHDELQSNGNVECLQMVKDTQESCQVAIGILSEMLMFDKVESGLLVLEKETIPPVQFIKSILSPFTIQAREAGVNFIFNQSLHPDYTHIALNADPNKLAQVIRNLVSNAMKFTKRDGTITVSVSAELRTSTETIHGNRSSQMSFLCAMPSESESFPLELVLSVTDSGAGISKENQARLFKGVVQFNPGKLQGGQGTGLGLFITKSIVDVHGGTISVHSEGEGLGSTFTVRLPLERGDHSAGFEDIENRGEEDLTLDTAQNNDSIEGSQLICDCSPEREFLPSPFNLSSIPLHGIYHSTMSSSRGELLYPPDASEHSQPDTLLDSLHENLFGTSSPSHQQGDHKILVVDDSALNRKMICKLLAKKNAQCDQAEDGLVAVNMIHDLLHANLNALSSGNSFCQDSERKNALETLEVFKQPDTNHNYDLILMDYQMPQMDGPAAIAEIRRMGYRGPIFGLTGNGMQSDQQKMISAGANKVLLKPIDLDLLWEEFLAMKNVLC